MGRGGWPRFSNHAQTRLEAILEAACCEPTCRWCRASRPVPHHHTNARSQPRAPATGLPR
eukprot:1331720-Prymnesium_polylepis.1